MRKAWAGVAGGGGVAVIGGIAAHFIKFFNLENPAHTMVCGVAAKRLGVVAHMGVSASVAVMTGVSDKNEVRGLKSSGADFAFDFGAKWGAMVKAGGQTAKALKLLHAVSDASSMKKFLTSENAKALFNFATGDLGLSSTTPSFAMFGTPAGVGLGAGIWYEWQSVQNLSGGDAWKHFKPRWRIVPHMGELWLQMKDIPEEDGSTIIIDFMEEAWGYDKSLVVSEEVGGMEFTVISGTVRNFQLHEKDYLNIPGAPEGGGLNLSWRTLKGRHELKGGFFEDKKLVTTPLPNQTIRVGLQVARDAKHVWTTDKYAKVNTDGTGDFSQVVSDANWLD